ncbi:MAG: hypothetical protein SFU20_14695 [Chitinophagaceae bacterium]|nr:hypothetical protein [Chitinophagaceae bacterium]
MRKFSLSLILVLSFFLTIQAQHDPRLVQRLDSTLLATRAMDFNRILDLTYPKLFDLVERDQMKAVLRSTFDNNQFLITLDSLTIASISPVMTVGTGQYVKVQHTMLMIFHFKDTAGKENIETEKLVANTMAMQYGDENVKYDEVTRSIRVFTKPEMIGAKDDISPEWTFVNYKKGDMITELLFSKEIRDKLAEN